MNKLINSIISPLRRFSCLSPHRKMTALATAAFVLAAGIMIPQVAGTLAAPPPGATALNVSNGVIEFTATQAIQNSVVIGSLNSSGYVLSGTTSLNTGNGNANVKVDPGVTVTLYLNNINITSGNSASSGSGILTTGADVTIVLLDGTNNTMTSGAYGGCIVKNGMDSHKLIITCEHSSEPGHVCNSTCGKLNCTGNNVFHAAAIGSSNDAVGGTQSGHGGFCNLYIEGGIITATSGQHCPGIGSMCGNTYFYNSSVVNLTTPQFLPAYGGQICKNINITGGQVYATGGDSCSGIGSGWGGPVDGIYISGTAYVKAVGGINSPGIGSGGCGNSNPYPTAPGVGNVSNIVISGGQTVVEAIGSSTVFAANDPGSPYTAQWIGTYPKPGVIPGIGVGYVATGRYNPTITNVVAQPLPNWYAVVKQGTSIADAVYVPGAPSAANMNIAPNMFYTLVRFTQAITKTASLNGGPDNAGTADNPVPVHVGDSIRYTIAAGGSDATGAAPYIISDIIPAGLTLSMAAGSYSPGMTTSVSGGVTTVEWDNLTGNQSVFFTVTVDSADNSVSFTNKAVKDEGEGITFTSDPTYYKLYAEIRLYIRQVVLGPVPGAEQPQIGYFSLTDSAKNTYLLTGISQTDVASPDQAYTEYLLPAAGVYKLSDTIPQYYKYVGYWFNADNGKYTSAAGIDKTNNTLTFSDTAKTLYVTVYITPTTSFITNYQWSIATNNVGTINP